MQRGLYRLTMMYGSCVRTSTSGEEIWRVKGEKDHHEWTFIDPKVRSRSYEGDDLSWDFPCSQQSMLVSTPLVTTTGGKARPLKRARMRKRAAA